MWGPAATWAAVLFLLSAWPNPKITSFLGMNDKAVHALLYAVMGFALAFGRSRGAPAPRHFVMIGAGFVYGAADEWHQRFVAGRVPDLGDWIADATGVTMGYAVTMLAIGWLVARAHQPRESNVDG